PRLWSSKMGSLCVCLCLTFLTPIPTDDPTTKHNLDGLWTGGWGGGQRGGVVFQPVLAELFILDNQVELAGFPSIDRLAGKLHGDAAAKVFRVTTAPQQQTEFRYELRGDALTLTDSTQRSIILQRMVTSRQPL